MHHVSNADVVALLSGKRAGTPHSKRESVRVLYYEGVPVRTGGVLTRGSVGSAAGESC